MKKKMKEKGIKQGVRNIQQQKNMVIFFRKCQCLPESRIRMNQNHQVGPDLCLFLLPSPRFPPSIHSLMQILIITQHQH